MHSPSYLSPQCTTEAGRKQCWPHRQALTVLSVGYLSAKNTCVTAQALVWLNMCLCFRCPSFTLLNWLCVQEVWLNLKSTARYVCLVLFWKEKDTRDQTQAMQSLQATPVRISNRFEIDVKIKNLSFLYINHFGPETRQHHTLSQSKFSTNLNKTKPQLQRIETYLKLI